LKTEKLQYWYLTSSKSFGFSSKFLIEQKTLTYLIVKVMCAKTANGFAGILADHQEDGDLAH